MASEIYRSTVLGDERTPPIKAELPLPAAEVHTYLEVEHLRDLIQQGDDAITRLRQIQAKCKHHYFKDTAGFPYDYRKCAVCGKSMGQL